MLASPAPRRNGWTTVVDACIAAHERGDAAAVRTLVERHPLHLFYHLEIPHLARILEDAVAVDPKLRDTAFALSLFVRSSRGGRFFEASVLDALATSNRAVQIAYMFDLRLQGRPVESLEYAKHRLGDLIPIQPVADAHDGWAQFVVVQRGTTAMLAGRMTEAIREFEDAQMRASTPGLEFLLRDTLVKHALVQATVGDPTLGSALLLRARAVPRTGSWVEPTIDAAHALAEAMLEPSPEKARAQLQTIDASALGEMWPFYAHAEYRVLDNSGAFAFASHRLEQLDALPFPRVDKQGYTGTVIPLALALNSIATGAPSLARQYLERVDPDFVLCGIVKALLELQTGALPKAISLATELRTSTRHLRRVELWRLSILADAHLRNGDEAMAITVLQQIDDLPGSVSRFEEQFFSLDLQGLAEQHVNAWPAGNTTEGAYMDQLIRLEGHFTDRELEIIRALPKSASRRALAESLFISENTLKTQLRSVFRKLEVGSREEAVSEAARRGLL